MRCTCLKKIELFYFYVKLVEFYLNSFIEANNHLNLRKHQICKGKNKTIYETNITAIHSYN